MVSQPLCWWWVGELPPGTTLNCFTTATGCVVVSADEDGVNCCSAECGGILQDDDEVCAEINEDVILLLLFFCSQLDSHLLK